MTKADVRRAECVQAAAAPAPRPATSAATALDAIRSLEVPCGEQERQRRSHEPTVARTSIPARPALGLALLCLSAAPGLAVQEDERAHSPATAFAESGEVTALVAAFEAAARIGPVWDAYDFARHPVVLVGEGSVGGGEARPCAAIWRAGEPLEPVDLDAALAFPMPLFAFWNGAPLGEQATGFGRGLARTMERTAPEIEAALRARHTTCAVLIPLPLPYEALGPIGERLAERGFPSALTHTLLAVHESYHLHSQLAAWMDQDGRYAWPTWAGLVDRRQTIARAYEGSAEVRAAHATELGHLLAAWDALYLRPQGEGPDVEAARAAAAAYGAARRARQRMLAQVSVPAAGGEISCALAEDVWELIEGSASYVASRTAHLAGLMSAEQVRSGYLRPLDPAFYQSGSMQLWILEGLLGAEALRAQTAAILRSEGPEGAIFGRFAAAVEGAR